MTLKCVYHISVGDNYRIGQFSTFFVIAFIMLRKLSHDNLYSGNTKSINDTLI